MNPEDFLSRNEARTREKQAQCSHPSLKCSICGKYQDNIQNEYKAKIDILLVILNQYEHIMNIHNIAHPEYHQWLESGIIESFRKDVIRQYRIKYERYSDEHKWQSE